MTDFALYVSYTSCKSSKLVLSFALLESTYTREERKSNVTIYMDAVWLLNFFIDFMLLMLTKAIIRDQTKNTRLLFGAFVASLLVPLSIYFPESFFTSLIGKFLYSILIILSAFRFTTIYQMGKLFILFYFISFAIGGGLIGLHYLTQSTFQLSTNG